MGVQEEGMGVEEEFVPIVLYKEKKKKKTLKH